MVDINFNKRTLREKETDKEHHLKPTWAKFTGHVKTATAAALFGDDGGDEEYLSLIDEFYPTVSGKVLEIGAGTGFLAKKILEKNENVEYTVLDIEKNIPYVQSMLKDFPDVQYISSKNYKDIFSQEWDLLIETHCLSETPIYYYTDILNNISTKACFVIDYGGDPNDPDFDTTLNNWFEKFPNREKKMNMNLLGAAKRGGIPVYIGKNEK